MIKLSQKTQLPGFKNISIYDLLKFIGSSFKKGKLNLRSAAVSFHFFTALFPGLIFILTLIPYIPIIDFQERLLNDIQLMLPSNVFQLFEDTLNNLLLHKHHFLLSIGFILSIYYASRGINTLLSAFSDSFQIKLTRHPIKQRILSLGLFSIISFLFMISISISFFSESLLLKIDSDQLDFVFLILYKIIKWVIILFFMLLAIGILYNYGNTERKKFKLINAGSSFSTLAIIVVSKGLAKYFEHFDKYNELYGSIGTLLISLIWINIVSYVLILGFELYTKTEKLFSVNA